MAAGFQSLPAELFLLILSFAGEHPLYPRPANYGRENGGADKSSWQTLSRCSLVARSWRRPAQRLMWSTVWASGAKDIDEAAAPPSSALVCSLLARLVGVRKLVLDDWWGEEYEGFDPSVFWLPSLSAGLRSLELDRIDFMPQTPINIPLTFHLTRLKLRNIAAVAPYVAHLFATLAPNSHLQVRTRYLDPAADVAIASAFPSIAPLLSTLEITQLPHHVELAKSLSPLMHACDRLVHCNLSGEEALELILAGSPPSLRSLSITPTTPVDPLDLVVGVLTRFIDQPVMAGVNVLYFPYSSLNNFPDSGQELVDKCMRNGPFALVFEHHRVELSMVQPVAAVET
ncbi:hypothetical protein MNV49_001914 [Pseudohyphozyma bogoriensis]|nr:hypothetical protein MNV49_001914 [Pseudohyphozyma bogoriensis]